MPIWVKLVMGIVLVLAGAIPAAYIEARIKDDQIDRLQLADAKQIIDNGKAIAAFTRARDQKTYEIALLSAQHQTQIQTRTITLLQRIPVYVTAQTDRKFPMPLGFIRVYNAALTGSDLSTVPDPARAINDTPSGIPASEVAENAVGNYGSCRAEKQKLADLQRWVSTMIKENGTP